MMDVVHWMSASYRMPTAPVAQNRAEIALFAGKRHHPSAKSNDMEGVEAEKDAKRALGDGETAD
jgi:hypothetical protein